MVGVAVGVTALTLRAQTFDDEIIRGPYLQAVTSTSAMILWNTENANVGSVRCWLPDGARLSMTC